MSIPAVGSAESDGLVGRHVLFVHAHPDDETIATGGTIARLVGSGVRVGVLTATRGECGEVVAGVDVPDGPDGLIGVRTAELALALEALGVTDHYWLGTPPARAPGLPDRHYADSGMQWGSAGLAVPADQIPVTALGLADPAEPLGDLVALVRTITPDLVVSYDSGGGYGHPDHRSMHTAARAAAALAGLPFAEVVDGVDAGSADGADADGADADRHRAGDRLPVVSVDVTAQRDTVVRALRAYRTQLASVDDTAIVHVGGQRRLLADKEWFRIR